MMPPLLDPHSLGLTDDVIQAELQAIAAESIGWLPLEQGAYLHVSDANAAEVLVVGIPQHGDAVLLLG